jgi:hypothetical protein
MAVYGSVYGKCRRELTAINKKPIVREHNKDKNVKEILDHEIVLEIGSGKSQPWTSSPTNVKTNSDSPKDSSQGCPGNEIQKIRRR